MKFITIDIGSTFVKAGLFDVDSRQDVGKIKYATPGKRKDSDIFCFENRALDFVRIVKQIIQEYVEIYTDVSGVLFSTQQHGCVICHPELPEDVYISWQDTRSLQLRDGGEKSYMQELQERFSREDMEVNGVYIKPALALCNLYTLFEKGELSRSEETKIYTLGSYIIEHLTGNNICHITNAAPMGFADIIHSSWRWDMLRELNLDFFQLPKITNQMESCGYYAIGERRIAVFPDVGDVQTCVYGTDAENGDLVINIGTSGQLIYVTDSFKPGTYEVRPFYENNYCNVISCMPGGRNFDVQIDYVKDIGEKIFKVKLERTEIWNRIHQIGLERESNGLEVDCGFYELPDRLADGNIRHINHDNLKLQNVFWATALDYGRTYKKYANILCGDNTKYDTVYFIGGALLKNKELQEAIRQEMGVKKVVCAENDEVFCGMQKLVLQCVERMKTDETEN